MLQAAIARVLQDKARQRCRVHLMRNLRATVPKGQVEMVAALVRTHFDQTDAEATRGRLRQVVDSLEKNFAKRPPNFWPTAEHNVTAYAPFPRSPRRKV